MTFKLLKLARASSGHSLLFLCSANSNTFHVPHMETVLCRVADAVRKVKIHGTRSKEMNIQSPPPLSSIKYLVFSSAVPMIG